MSRIINYIKTNRGDIARTITITLTLLFFLLAGLSYANSQKVKQAQASQAQRAVNNHTETLNDIDNAVLQLKQDNQTRHDTTIRYIQCLGKLVIVSQYRTVTQADMDACLSVSGLSTMPSAPRSTATQQSPQSSATNPSSTNTQTSSQSPSTPATTPPNTSKNPPPEQCTIKLLGLCI